MTIICHITITTHMFYVPHMCLIRRVQKHIAICELGELTAYVKIYSDEPDQLIKSHI